MGNRVITFGTFDVFHVGHVNILEKCSQLGSELIVGVSSDALNFKKKNRYPVYDEYSRLKIIKSLKFVNEVFIEESLEQKRHYINYYRANILAMGDDWEGRFDDLRDICEVTYFPRTPSISTTEIIEIARKL
ncbi:adenylyltransferase/cytidyltransferase family protein [Shewanella sp. HN-41]|uniref:adenylyltransferase/cytidyltransferase family protein n=1 Tax=Shewanella sp. HN-41 TaxID=327275 RepID=UPI0005631C27|nr:adenylyltransferase/cytidyltransferase family protein [Shewanella sp. HN-41]